MKILHWWKLNTCMSLETHKVQSHIKMEDAPDKTFWMVNNIADGLKRKKKKNSTRKSVTMSDDIGGTYFPPRCQGDLYRRAKTVN